MNKKDAIKIVSDERITEGKHICNCEDHQKYRRAKEFLSERIDVMIKTCSNGFVLNDDEVFEYGKEGINKQMVLTWLLNRVLEELGEESWKAEVIG